MEELEAGENEREENQRNDDRIGKNEEG